MSPRKRVWRPERPPTWAAVALAVSLGAFGVLLAFTVSTGRPHAGAAEAATAVVETTAPAPASANAVIRPPDRPLRVLFIGDSLMEGSFASQPELSYRALVVATLSGDGPVEEARVGRSGETVGSAAAALQQVTGPVDVVVVQIGSNDSVDITPAQFHTDYGLLLDGVRTLAPDAALVCAGVWNGPEYASPFDRELRPLCAEHGGRVVPLTALYVDEDLRGPEGTPTAAGVLRDQFHPNDRGHAAIAAALLEALDI